jgi:His-Xaa-Ser system protein HxsD
MTGNANGVGITIKFAREADFNVEAIKRAAYRFSDRIATDITADGGEFSCCLRALDANAANKLDAWADEFRNEVLDQDLRLKIARETEGYRNLILSLAFSKTPLGQ